jgi:hypothetical protein
MEKLKGPTNAQIISHNQWAATAIDKYHFDSKATFEFDIEGIKTSASLSWDSEFSKSAMKEEKDMANHGGVVDQSTFYTDLKNTTFQDNADKAIHRFIKLA